MKCSFVIPTYNNAHFLPIAVDSVLKQTYENIELLIVDDASTDFTWQYLDWLEAKKDERIKIIRLEKNSGRSAARNSGNKAATGELLFVLDADDAATPNRAELTVRKYKSSGADYIYGSYTAIDSVGNELGQIRADVFNREKASEELVNRIGHSTVAYTKAIAENFPHSSDPEVSRLGIDDWEQQIRISMAGKKFDFVPQLIGVYRLSDAGVTATRDSGQVIAYKRAFLDALKVSA